MKASENPSIQKYLGDVCYPIAYAEVKIGKLIDEDWLKHRFEKTDAVNPYHTRVLVRTDKNPEVEPLESILLDVHSKGRANRKYENSNTHEFDRVGYKY